MTRVRNSDCSVPGCAWYALYTRHQHEKTVAELLAKKSFTVFLPLYEAAHRWKDRVKHLSLPLFPSYVFVYGGLDRQLQMMMTPGVYSIVTVASKAQPIPDVEIDAIRHMVEGPLRVEPHPFLKCGDWVRVKRGPLEGLEGILVRTKGLFRLVISVEMLAKSVAVEVDAALVERVPQCAPAAASRSQQRLGVFAYSTQPSR